ncbi:hypothetical protein SAMN05660841_02785 [Sphingobacterium nematocida]|uniref:Uncharacterized protein n=1 Tax=Sphingobacterium nematocida TaxID=1513896 RepID=A0A1T5ETF9_9SPHI|nr:hypothetical protein SAMN05660841_02785 [Sphingobacterium nematocida]
MLYSVVFLNFQYLSCFVVDCLKKFDLLLMVVFVFILFVNQKEFRCNKICEKLSFVA